jgi:hypothetical protein
METIEHSNVETKEEIKDLIPTCTPEEEEMNIQYLFTTQRPIRTQLQSTTLTIPIRLLNAELTCAVCLGIIRNCTAVMECLHRFCGSCIEKSLRFGKKQVNKKLPYSTR